MDHSHSDGCSQKIPYSFQNYAALLRINSEQGRFRFYYVYWL